MLETMRQRGSSIFIYLIFGVLIAVFVINFGPSGGARGGGCSTSGNTAIQVDGNQVNLTAYHVAFSNPYNQEQGEQQRRYFALETLVRRELLADAAESRGLRVSGDMVDEEIKKGFFFLGGERIPLNQYIYDTHEDGTKTWSGGKFKRWVNSLDVRSTSSYRDEQIRGLQATLMAETLAASARVSREEAKTQYIYDHTTVSYDLVKFSPSSYRTAMKLSEADVQRYLATHEADVKAKFAADERSYKGTKKAARLRQIFIAKADVPASPAAGSGSAAASASGSATPSEPAALGTLPIEVAKAKLEAARVAITSGKQTFAEAAKLLATDPMQRFRGGDLGWRSVETPGLGDAAANAAVKGLKDGELSPVIVTDGGVYLVMVEASHEGDLTYDAVKLEIADDLARTAWSAEAAKRDALKALALASTVPLDKQFERDVAPLQMNPGNLQLPDSMSPEQKARIIEQLQQQIKQGGTGKSGALEVESKDVPAGWSAPDDTSGSSAAGPSAAGSGAGAGSGSAAATPAVSVPPTVPAAGAIVPSTDVLPAFNDVAKPKIESETAVKRMTNLPSIGKDAVDELFTGLEKGQLANRIYEVEGAFVVVQLTDKESADLKNFAKDADEMIATLQETRGAVLVHEWLGARCAELAKAGKIVPSSELVRNTDAKGTPLPTTYRPCMSFK